MDVITTSIVIYVYFKKKTLNIAVGIILGVGAIIGAQIGSAIAHILPVVPLEYFFQYGPYNGILYDKYVLPYGKIGYE